jgi:hypothetical protein
MSDFQWSGAEKKVARWAYEAAHNREYAQLKEKIRQIAGEMREVGGLWRLHDFLRRKLGEIDLKYDYRYSKLSLVFARLIHEGWLSLEELEGLREDKLAAIEAILSPARQQARVRGANAAASEGEMPWQECGR